MKSVYRDPTPNLIRSYLGA